jgi:hypothetical protein
MSIGKLDESVIKYLKLKYLPFNLLLGQNAVHSRISTNFI